MGLSPQVVHQVIEVSKLLPKEKTNRNVLSLGYPDVLADIKVLEDLGLTGLEIHPESKQKASFHGRGNINVPTAESFFKALNLNLTVGDLKDWEGNGKTLIFDLNKEIDNPPQFNYVIDNGTIEHCFNIPQAMKNISNLCALGGYVSHWNPQNMMNHGFYGLNPTFYYDWYVTQGFKVESISLYNFEKYGDGFVEKEYPLTEEMFTKRFNFPSFNNSILTLVHKPVNIESSHFVWPVQSKYKRMGL